MSNRIRGLLVLALAALPGAARAQSLTSDLAMVPSDAVVVVHLRAADLWKHDILKGLRDTVAAAGPKAIEAFEKQAYPNPADLDRLTLVLTLNDQKPNSPPNVVLLVAFKNAVDGAKLQKLHLPEAKETTVGTLKMLVDADRELAVYQPDPKLVAIGPPKAMQAFLAKAPGKGDGALAAAIEQMPGKVLTVAANVKGLPIPPQAFDQIPPDIRPLAMAERVLFTIDGSTSAPVFELKAIYASDAASAEAEKGFKAAVGMAKQAMKQPRGEMESKLYPNADKGPQGSEKMAEAAMALVALGALNRAEEQLDKLPLTRAGSDLALKYQVPAEFVGAIGQASTALAMLLPAVHELRSGASSSRSANNMKQIGLAMHNMHDAYGQFPGAAICDKDGKPLLSWRVHILPYIEQENLYRQFKLDEPWDSPNNKPLVEKMPAIYANPRVETKPGMTVYKVFVGKDAMFDWKAGRKMHTITDGMSNTLMTAEGGEPVIWTKPEDIEVDMAKPLPKLELPGGQKSIYVGFADGSVRRLDLAKFDEKVLKAFIGVNDGMITPPLEGENRGMRMPLGAQPPLPPSARPEQAMPAKKGQGDLKPVKP